ncbi:AfsR/SARP family transcriptional regulator [Nocardioides coralli]|uniref:AfsR/SARP family transcriptional regulator n=1 Tax=Nocardioides coralli TaxID=2872154 RepID=UPI001CA38A7B|nr:bacterial transcriptional activator domain-containing protein [Nocardioides coralli]QZY27854.1 bacterial transcriptional activator domain-containing protein [Nocardioides coralli]
MTTAISLLGSPAAVRDGERVEVRGHKPWLLLALLLLGDRPPSRERLQRLLFLDATDPAAALRWNLSQLRRLGIEVAGDPVVATVPADVDVDLARLDGGAADAAELPGLDEELLATIRPEPGTDLAVWLDEERRHLRQLAHDVRQEAALALLGRGDTQRALAHARRVVEAAPLDENAAALLVRCLRADGRVADARAAAQDAATRLREELGVEPTHALWSAVAAPLGGDRQYSGSAAVLAQIEAGESAVNAGAIDTGLRSLQGAVLAARALREEPLLARALVSLGSSLIHGVRGVDQEGLAMLHEAVPLTEQVGDAPLAVVARREIGYVDFLRGRYDRATHWFGRARDAADAGTSGLGWVDLYDGASADDVGDTPRARLLLESALEKSAAERDLRLESFARTMLGRSQLLAGEADEAHHSLRGALDVARALDWTGFLPFPEALLAESTRMRGDTSRSRELAEHALVTGEQVGDPCWESLAVRTLGLVSIDQGDVSSGVALLEEAPARCRRLPDTYRWIEMWGYAALLELVDRQLVDDRGDWRSYLQTEASAMGMRPMVDQVRLSG